MEASGRGCAREACPWLLPGQQRPRGACDSRRRTIDRRGEVCTSRSPLALGRVVPRAGADAPRASLSGTGHAAWPIGKETQRRARGVRASQPLIEPRALYSSRRSAGAWSDRCFIVEQSAWSALSPLVTGRSASLAPTASFSTSRPRPIPEDDRQLRGHQQPGQLQPARRTRQPRPTRSATWDRTTTWRSEPRLRRLRQAGHPAARAADPRFPLAELLRPGLRQQRGRPDRRLRPVRSAAGS